MWVAGKVLSLHLKLLDIDHPLAFEQSKLRQIEDHALIYPSRPKRSKNPTRCSLYKGDSPPPPLLARNSAQIQNFTSWHYTGVNLVACSVLCTVSGILKEP